MALLIIGAILNAIGVCLLLFWDMWRARQRRIAQPGSPQEATTSVVVIVVGALLVFVGVATVALELANRQ